MATETTTKRIIDSAAIISIITGLSYIAGFVADARLRALRFPGMPWHLLPELPLYRILLLGGVYVLLFVVIGLLIYLLISQPIGPLPRISAYAQHRFKNHPIASSIFFGSIACTAFVLAPLYLWLPPSLKDPRLPKVVELKISNQQPITIKDNWRFVSRKDGIMVFSLPSEHQLILINAGDLEQLILESPPAPSK